MDLQFPHHENEIAQSEGATGQTFVNVWMHNGFVRVNEEKMSKSLGNFFTVREVLRQYRPETVRFFILNSHYRSPLNYSDESLDEADAALTRLYTALRGIPAQDAIALDDAGRRERFDAAMNDDFNTAEAIAVLFDLARDINRSRESAPAQASRLAGLLRELGGVLGLLQDEADAWLKSKPVSAEAGVAAAGDAGAEGQSCGLSADAIETLIQDRLAARKARDWALADRIRDELKDQGVVLEDAAGGTTWRRA